MQEAARCEQVVLAEQPAAGQAGSRSSRRGGKVRRTWWTGAQWSRPPNSGSCGCSMPGLGLITMEGKGRSSYWQLPGVLSGGGVDPGHAGAGTAERVVHGRREPDRPGPAWSAGVAHRPS